MKNRVFETVLYYTPEPSEKAVKLKGVLVRMGKYSLQGTTQGRYLTGGVPPVRFSM